MIDFVDYNFNDRRKILGDLENGPIPKTIILLTKKVVYDSFKVDKKNFYYLYQKRGKTLYYLVKTSTLHAGEKNFLAGNVKYQNFIIKTHNHTSYLYGIVFHNIVLQYRKTKLVQ